MAVIGTNVAALFASNYLDANTSQLTKSIQRMASGSRLADPSDDAAGVAVSGNLSARLQRLDAASNSVRDMVSLAQTADGFLSTIQGQVTRLSELAEEATNGAFGNADRKNYDTEFQKLLTQIDAITSHATFDGVNLFPPAAASAVPLVTTYTIGGAGSPNVAGVENGTSFSSISSAVSGTLVLTNGTLSGSITDGNGYTWDITGGSLSNDDADLVINGVTGTDATDGATLSGTFAITAAVIGSSSTGGTPAGPSPDITVGIDANGTTDSLTLSSVGTTASLGLTGLSILTTTGAVIAVKALTNAISKITNRRAEVNADISKFNFYVSNISTEAQNVTQANSRITDLDVAAESTNLSKYNILVRSATAELTQANSSQRAVLSLLRRR